MTTLIHKIVQHWGINEVMTYIYFDVSLVQIKAAINIKHQIKAYIEAS